MNMKWKGIILLCVGTMLLSGCTKRTQNHTTIEQSTEIESLESISEETSTEETTITDPSLDDTIYIGEYLDSDIKEPNLEIGKREDGKYIIQIGIYRLTFIEDGIGELTAEGMNFTATDASGNPISGVITVDQKTATATVTFTDSTWEYLKNGDSFQYTKSSDIPNLQ